MGNYLKVSKFYVLILTIFLKNGEKLFKGGYYSKEEYGTYNFDRKLPSWFMKSYDQNFTKNIRKEILTLRICTMFRVSRTDIDMYYILLGLHSILFLLCLNFCQILFI
jgi:hypothetical protein